MIKKTVLALFLITQSVFGEQPTEPNFAKKVGAYIKKHKAGAALAGCAIAALLYNKQAIVDFVLKKHLTVASTVSIDDNYAKQLSNMSLREYFQEIKKIEKELKPNNNQSDQDYGVLKRKVNAIEEEWRKRPFLEIVSYLNFIFKYTSYIEPIPKNEEWPAEIQQVLDQLNISTEAKNQYTDTLRFW